MANSAELLARELADLKRRIAAMERKSQVINSTINVDDGVPVSLRDCVLSGMSAGAAAAEALDRAASAEAKADGAVVTFFGDTAPGAGAKFGDLWRTEDGAVKQYDGEDWIEITDPQLAANVEAALDRIANTEEALDGKVTTYFRASSSNPAYDPEVTLCVGDLWIVSDGGNLIRRWNGATWVDAPAGAAALADHAVTSSKLEADLVLTTRVIAGNPTGKRAEMNPDGFHVFVSDGVSDREVARLGVAGESDKLVMSQSTGGAVASISEDGSVSGTQLNSDSVFYKGDELTQVLDARPRGVVAYGKRATHQTSLAYVTRFPYLRVDAVLYPGRLYRVYTNPIVTVTNNGGAMSLSYNVSDQCTVYNDTIIDSVRIRNDWGQEQVSALYSLPPTTLAPTTVSFLLSVVGTSGSGYAGLYCEAERPAYLIVEDVGTTGTQDTGVFLNVHSDTAPLADRQTLTVNHSRITVYYNGSNEYAPGSSTWTNGWIGRWTDTPDPENPSAMDECVTMLTFPDVTTQLSGRTVISARVLIPIESWRHPSGKDSFAVSVHGCPAASTAPVTMPDISSPVANAYWAPAPSSRWVQLPDSVLPGLKTGTVRGVLLHRPSSRALNSEYYDGSNYWGQLGTTNSNAAGDPVYAQLEITYQ